MSGSRVLANGVGTAIETVSACASTASSVDATKRPLFTCFATCAAGTSWMCDSPCIRSPQTRSLTSYPTTRNPASHNSIASGRPT